MKILNFGSMNIDYVYSVNHICNPGETESSEGLSVFPGGKGLNQSVALARAGAGHYFAGCIGGEGMFLENLLSDCGVDTHLIKHSSGRNGHAIIQVSDSGENSIIIFHGANYENDCEYIDAVLHNFHAGDYLILQNEINDADYIIGKAYDIGMKIILNPSPLDDVIKKVNLNKIEYLILNEVEAGAFIEFDGVSDFADKVRERFKGLKVVLTLGKRGCVYIDGENIIRQSTFDVKAVDTTAAGDTFLGYFISGTVRGLDIKETLKLASAAAAISVTRAGAASSIPLLDEVMKTMPEMTEKQSDEPENIIRKFFEKHYLDGKSADLAKLLGYSQSYTERVLKNKYNTSFKKLQIEARCAAAAEMLANTDFPIMDIIYNVGYSNEGFFRRNFTAVYGKSPREYRKEKKRN